MGINNFFDENIADKNVLAEDGTIDAAVNVAESHADSGKDTYRHSGKKPSDYEAVCVKCVSNIFKEAKIPFPATNSVVTLMDAFKGYKVNLYNEDGTTSDKRFANHSDWSPVVNAQDLKKGDVLIVKNMVGGLHATFVTNVSGSMDDQGYFSSYYTGVDIIHDQGAPGWGWDNPVSRGHYEWSELGGRLGSNRSFHAAFRYTGGEK